MTGKFSFLSSEKQRQWDFLTETMSHFSYVQYECNLLLHSGVLLHIRQVSKAYDNFHVDFCTVQCLLVSSSFSWITSMFSLIKKS